MSSIRLTANTAAPKRVYGVTGSIKVVFGPMFSGKSTLCNLSRIQHEIAKRRVLTIKPRKDTRGKPGVLWTHSSQEIDSHPVERVEKASEILTMIDDDERGDIHVVQIDEAQWMDEGILSVCAFLDRQGYIVEVYGCSGTFQREKFGYILDLIPFASECKSLHAICLYCGNGRASFTVRTSEENERDIPGGADSYKSACNSCFYKYNTHHSP